MTLNFQCPFCLVLYVFFSWLTKIVESNKTSTALFLTFFQSCPYKTEVQTFKFDAIKDYPVLVICQNLI
uniref:Uncharacterized protein n=1 Tax=Rhizophora mucronata TaxID=61149 RepID=A0A2P2KXK3_RHIMU